MRENLHKETASEKESIKLCNEGGDQEEVGVEVRTSRVLLNFNYGISELPIFL